MNTQDLIDALRRDSAPEQQKNLGVLAGVALLMQRAADEIERLAARVDELEDHMDDMSIEGRGEDR